MLIPCGIAVCAGGAGGREAIPIKTRKFEQNQNFWAATRKYLGKTKSFWANKGKANLLFIELNNECRKKFKI